MNHDRQQDWSGRESYERTRREKLERLRQEDLNWRPRGSQGNSGPSRGASKRQSYFCRVCNVTSMSREMHDKHERSRKHLENAGREDDGADDNRDDDGRYDRMGRRTSDASDVVIIEDQSARISDKKRGATSSFEEEEKKVEQEEKKGDCTDCQKPMGDKEEHMRKNHRDLFISCKLCLQAGYSPFLVLSWDELGEHLRSTHSKPENETKNPDLPFFAKVLVSSSKGVAYCNLCPPNTSFWTSDGSVSRRKVLAS